MKLYAFYNSVAGVSTVSAEVVRETASQYHVAGWGLGFRGRKAIPKTDLGRSVFASEDECLAAALLSLESNVTAARMRLDSAQRQLGEFKEWLLAKREKAK